MRHTTADRLGSQTCPLVAKLASFILALDKIGFHSASVNGSRQHLLHGNQFCGGWMRRTYFWAIVLAVVLRAGVAQAAPKPEVFGGYQFTHLDGGPNLNGWNAALTGYLNSFLGITADLTGVYGSGLSFHTYTFGPRSRRSSAAGKTFCPCSRRWGKSISGRRFEQRLRCVFRGWS